MSLQSTITAENTLAYKSLVEDPKELLFMAPIEDRSDRDEMATSTLPRTNSNLPNESNKAATLSKLLRKTKDSEPSTSSASSPLKILRDKSFPIGKPRLKILPSVGSESVTSTTFLLDHDGENPCETPSYMAQGNFTLNVEAKETPKIDDNPLPLPPRDRSNLQLNVAQKRHVRKHPLIIPATGIQRTLDKINQVTPVEEKQEVFPVPKAQEEIAKQAYIDDDDDDDVFEELKNDTKISHDFEKNVNHYGTIKSEENYTKSFIENNFPASSLRHSLIELSGHRTYENLEAFHKRFSCVDEADTASLHFESILEDDNVGNISDDDIVDGFCAFESVNIAPKPQTTSAEAPAKKPERKSLQKPITSTIVIESKKLEFSQKYPKYKMPRNELATNSLFNKIKESVENASMVDECEVELSIGDECGSDLKKSINHVSCEDLLDFSDKKPKGRERGAESDEVRIMTKMFGNKVS